MKKLTVFFEKMYPRFTKHITYLLPLAAFIFLEGKEMDNHKEAQKTSFDWLTYAKEITASKTGTFSTKDKFGVPIVMEWERIDWQSPRLTEKIKSLSEILVQAYAQVEVEFAQKLPDAVPNDFMLKSLAPLFEQGIEKVDWKIVEEKIKATLQQFLTTTDWAKSSGANDVHLFIVVKDNQTGTPLGLIQFLITPEYTEGNVKAALYGVMPTSQQRGLEELLMSSIFKLIPEIKRIFLHTRITNEHALNGYRTWGFTQFPGPLANWIDLEYLAERSDILQKTAETLID